MRISDWSSDVCSSDLETHLGRVDHVGHGRVERRQRTTEPGHRPDQPHRRVKSVVTTVIIVGEEDMAAHLTGQRGAGLLHLGLDEAVTGLTHPWLTSQLYESIQKHLPPLNYSEDLRPRPFT